MGGGWVQRGDPATADRDNNRLGTRNQQVLLQAGVVAHRGMLAAVAPGDVSNNRWLRVDGGGRQPHGQGLRGIVGRLDHRLRGQRAHRSVEVVET